MGREWSQGPVRVKWVAVWACVRLCIFSCVVVCIALAFRDILFKLVLVLCAV